MKEFPILLDRLLTLSDIISILTDKSYFMPYCLM